MVITDCCVVWFWVGVRLKLQGAAKQGWRLAGAAGLGMDASFVDGATFVSGVYMLLVARLSVEAFVERLTCDSQMGGCYPLVAVGNSQGMGDEGIFSLLEGRHGAHML